MDSKYSLITNSSNKSRIGFNGFSIKRKIENINENKTLLEKSVKKLKNSSSLNLENSINGAINKNGLNTQNHKVNQQPQPNQQSLLEQRKSLPVYACRTRIIHEIKKFDTLLIMGETGSGKTTQMPQFFHEGGYSNRGIIAITQPRRVAAITIAKRVAQETGTKLGELVGYTVRFEDCTSNLTRIKYITDGCLLREALSDRLLKNYSVIMLDEAHERTINTDVLFGIVKEAQKQRKLKNLSTLKIVVTSATMDIDHFGKYFGVRGMYLEGRTYPVRVMHTKQSQSDYVHACLVTLFEIHRTAPPNHDVLIFLTGQEEIDSMVTQIRVISKANELKAPSLRVFPLYSQLPQNKQLDCFVPSAPNSRKCILATNIAETSITIPGIRYIIDCGYVKRRVFDPITGMEILKVVRISQAQSWQRCGRAGRESSGFCYRTYTSNELDNFEKMTKPEILRSNITSTVLQLLALGIDCKSFDFLDKPKPEAVDSAYKQLQALNAIRNILTPDLTLIGKKMSQFPLDPKFSKLLLNAEEFKCLSEILSLVAVLSGENIFVSTTDKREQASLAHAKFESPTGDHLTLLNVYNAFIKTEKYKMWCHDNFLNARNLLYARDVRQQLEEISKRLELKIESCGQNFDQVRKCLLASFYNNLAEFNQRDNNYLTLTSRLTAKIHPSSVLSSKLPRAQIILYTELIATEKKFMKFCSHIELDWIDEIIPNFQYCNRIKNSAYS